MVGSEGMYVFFEVLFVVPKNVCFLSGIVCGSKKFVCSVRCCGYFRKVCVFCELLWMGPKECVCSVRCCVLVLMNICIL